MLLNHSVLSPYLVFFESAPNIMPNIVLLKTFLAFCSKMSRMRFRLFVQICCLFLIIP